MDDRDDELSRREWLKRTGATLSTLALGVACSDDNGEGTQSPSPGGTGAGEAGSTGQAGSNPGGAGGSTPAAGAGGGRAGSGGSGGSPPAASGSGGAPEPQAGAAGMPAGGSGAGAGGTPSSDGVTVAMVHIADLDAAVARAVELAGGIDAIQPGQTVFIKPNAVNNRAIGTPGIRTSNEVLAAVVRLVKQRNPGRIIVGDHSARGFDTATVFDQSGMTEAAMSAGADEIYLSPSPTQDPDAWMLMQPPGYETTWQAAGGILAMRKIIESDHLINVPTCKDHRYALFSLSMKNFIGAIGDSSRDPIHYGDTGVGNFDPIGRDIALLNQMFSPLMSIIDATTALINGGPQGDGADTVRTSPGLILASRDRVALDALAVSLIKLELGRTDTPQPDAANPVLKSSSPWELPQIREGGARGVGVASHDGVMLAFEDVADAMELEAIYRG